jgi:hypothetical protein
MSVTASRAGLVLGAFALAVAGLLVPMPGAHAADSPAVGQRWTAAPGQAFNDGWRPLSTYATYLPCQTVRWSFDRSNEDPARGTMINDVRTALGELQTRTGLTFTEVAAGAPADLTFRWGDLTAEGHPNAAGYGGFTGPGKGFVTFDAKGDWTLNKWEGWDWRRLEWPRPDLGPGWYSWKEGPGRVALALHESMHALGFGHVEDYTSLMYPQGGLPNNRGQFSPGDIAGLRTMYLDRPCTAVLSTPVASPSSTAGAVAFTPATSVVTQRVGQGARVVRATVSPGGLLTATVATRLRRGSTVTLRVTSSADGHVVDSSGLVQTGGAVRVSQVVPAGSSVEVRDARGRILVMWRASA